ncbi:alpha/beta fold hydrolase [Nocardia sp. NBC_00565]|uniref:esterase/lipase family protein n=1 Tax=Nocardia sp. NBC_00565 TaxID=2975993 RepID=UPI002E7FEBEF|nr:alpha/beta fold hydrolase [Nocardia sp. NBC_00565]WUC06665.1 alpha/beta fold hydrolase [Nocardia sp. NBC_00565]
MGALATLMFSSPAEAEPAPVQGNWSAAMAYSLMFPSVIPLGLNDFSCTPATAHPNPVVLVNGAFESTYANWSLLAPQLRSEGYCVFGLDYGNTGGLHQTGELRGSAREVAEFVDKVRAATGADKVDLVGHSEGGLVSLYFINRLGGADKVATMIGLAPFPNGLSAYGLLNAIAVNPALRDAVDSMVPAVADGTAGSDFVTETASGGMIRPEVNYLTISSRMDMVVEVAESRLPAAPNVTNLVIQDLCPADLADHNELSYDENVQRLIRNALDPGHANAPECRPVLPFVHQSPS